MYKTAAIVNWQRDQSSFFFNSACGRAVEVDLCSFWRCEAAVWTILSWDKMVILLYENVWSAGHIPH